MTSASIRAENDVYRSFCQTAKTDLPSDRANTMSVNREMRTRNRSQKRICPIVGVEERSSSRFPAEASSPSESR